MVFFLFYLPLISIYFSKQPAQGADEGVKLASYDKGVEKYEEYEPD